MKNLQILFLLGLLTAVIGGCSSEQKYETLGYVSYVGKPIELALELRETVGTYLKAQDCIEAQSNQTKFFKVKNTIDEKRPSKFIDIYDCKDNVFVFINQVNLTVSFFSGKKVETMKWKTLGQGIETVTLKKDAALKMIWNEANIKANVVAK